MYERILQKGSWLYRYNLGTNLPDQWAGSYHSPEYSDTEFGHKNQIGALFFYEDEITAKQVLCAALDKDNLNSSYSQNTITSCQLVEDVRLLDISNCEIPMRVLVILNEEGIDVLNERFLKHDNGDFRFSVLKKDFDFVMNAQNIMNNDVLGAANRINTFFHQKETESRYLGQLLTDFENGKDFRSQLVEKGFDGYCFTEEPSPTICIFDAAKLTSPLHKTV